MRAQAMKMAHPSQITIQNRIVNYQIQRPSYENQTGKGLLGQHDDFMQSHK